MMDIDITNELAALQTDALDSSTAHKNKTVSFYHPVGHQVTPILTTVPNSGLLNIQSTVEELPTYAQSFQATNQHVSTNPGIQAAEARSVSVLTESNAAPTLDDFDDSKIREYIVNFKDMSILLILNT